MVERDQESADESNRLYFQRRGGIGAHPRTTECEENNLTCRLPVRFRLPLEAAFPCLANKKNTKKKGGGGVIYTQKESGR